MTRDRLSIQQLTLIKRTTLHTPMIPTPDQRDRDDTPCSAAS